MTFMYLHHVILISSETSKHKSLKTRETRENSILTSLQAYIACRFAQLVHFTAINGIFNYWLLIFKLSNKPLTFSADLARLFRSPLAWRGACKDRKVIKN